MRLCLLLIETFILKIVKVNLSHARPKQRLSLYTAVFSFHSILMVLSSKAKQSSYAVPDEPLKNDPTSKTALETEESLMGFIGGVTTSALRYEGVILNVEGQTRQNPKQRKITSGKNVNFQAQHVLTREVCERSPVLPE